MNLLDPETLALLTERAGWLSQTTHDHYASNLSQETRRAETARQEAARLGTLILQRLAHSATWQTEEQAKAGVRYDGPYLGSLLALQFTDMDPASPAKGGSFLVHGREARDAQRQRFAEGATEAAA